MQSRATVDILSKAVELEDLSVQFPTHHGRVAPVIEPVKKPIHFPRLKKLVLKSGAGPLNGVPAPLLAHVETSSHEYHDSSAVSLAPNVLAAFRCPSLVRLYLGVDYFGNTCVNNIVINWSLLLGVLSQP